MRQIAARQPFIQPAKPFSSSASPHAAGLNHLLLAIGRAMSPPVVHMRSSFQPMRIIVVQPDLVSTIDHAAQWECETPQLLPYASYADPNTKQGEFPWQQRMVQGEILSDENGRLYEKLGRHIRPVHQLASGPSGELIEMIPVERTHLRVISQSPRVVDVHRSPGTEKPESKSSVVDDTTKKFVPVQPAEAEANDSGHRKLFTDPGQWRVVTWSDFKEILAPQLAHPERLRDTYRLPCYVQVVETNRDVAIEELAKAFSTKKGRPTPLYFLTDELTTKLELTPLLPPLPAVNGTDHRTTNILQAHQRVFRLLVANDPTVDVGSFKKGTVDSTSTTKTNDSQTGTDQSSATSILKTSIPSSFMKEWEFKLSREEVLFELKNRPLSIAIRRFARRLRFIKQHREFRKWQVLLTGKNQDEQLWSVRPPANLSGDSFVLEWVEKTLQLAGYDVRKMLAEWEIFWRRKGLS